MPISLYDAFVPSCLDMVGAVHRVLDKAEAYFVEQGRDPNEMMHLRLFDDMHPFSYQIKAVRTHSIGAIEAVRRGEAQPSVAPEPESLAESRQLLDSVRADLGQVTREEMESFLGRDLRLTVPGRSDINALFVAEDYLLSFVQSNFYFHVVTAYDILRAHGVPLSKRDYLGAWRVKTPA